MKYSVIQKCKKQTGFEALPDEQTTINLEKIKSILVEDEYFKILRETKVVYILETKKGKKVSLFPSGKILIYRVEEEEAQEVVEKISSLINKVL
ncbi:MAG: hypothetical protein K9W45_00600 [Candidatus Heimdallarchaeum aukensis]|uniref:Uncharacterized protein n=1 Tax=Candidatus Heimdallarchaeum aukensis TaxID=2876573 RepID=A0A9Y1BL17_9ARCH|nr:MAG: hypothetical protein K9W45_00600 [Candidatus Heimdallarchaeum aukensis]